MVKSFKIKALSLLILSLQFIIFKTCKSTFTGPKLKGPAILLFWHGKLSFIHFSHKYYIGEQSSYVMISKHKDGDIIAYCMKRFFGIKSIRGSTSRGAVAVLKEAFKRIKEEAIIMITPDGPRGPLKSISDGSVVIAQKKKLKVFLIDYKASSFWQLKSWDRHYIPKPFSKIDFFMSEGFSLNNMSVEAAKSVVKNKFDDLLLTGVS